MPNRLVPGAGDRAHRRFREAVERAWRKLGPRATTEQLETLLESGHLGETVPEFLRRYQEGTPDSSSRRKVYRGLQPRDGTGQPTALSPGTLGESTPRASTEETATGGIPAVELVKGMPESQVLLGEKFERSRNPKLFLVLLARIWPEPVGRPSTETIERTVWAREITILPPRSSGAAYSVQVVLRDVPVDRVETHDVYRDNSRERLAHALAPDGRANPSRAPAVAESVLDHFRFAPNGKLVLREVADELWRKKSNSLPRRIRRAYYRRWPAIERNSKHVSPEERPERVP